MQTKKRIAALLLAAALAAAGVLAWLRPPARAQPASDGFYRYELEPVESGAVSGGTPFNLYVRPAENGPALHTGTVALGLEQSRMVTSWTTGFTPADGMLTVSPDGLTSLEIGDTATGFHYAAFTWYMAQGRTAELDDDGRQFIGTVTLPFSTLTASLSAQDVALIPWPETETGAALLARTDLSAEDLALLTADVWRTPEGSGAGVMGFYQGFRASDGEDGPQERVDIRCAWQGLRLVSWDPEDPVTVEVYPRNADGTTYPDAPAYRLKLLGVGGQGLTARILALDQSYEVVAADGSSSGSVSLPEGVYKVTLQKQSHVTAAFLDVTVASGSVFPELTGVSLYLPCGDVDGDGHIRQADRARLTAPGVYGWAAASGGPYDLDGDGRVTQYDLAILTAPANYGKDDLAIRMSEEGSG